MHQKVGAPNTAKHHHLRSLVPLQKSDLNFPINLILLGKTFPCFFRIRFMFLPLSMSSLLLVLSIVSLSPPPHPLRILRCRQGQNP